MHFSRVSESWLRVSGFRGDRTIGRQHVVRLSAPSCSTSTMSGSAWPSRHVACHGAVWKMPSGSFWMFRAWLEGALRS